MRKTFIDTCGILAMVNTRDLFKLPYKMSGLMVRFDQKRGLQ